MDGNHWNYFASKKFFQKEQCKAAIYIIHENLQLYICRRGEMEDGKLFLGSKDGGNEVLTKTIFASDKLK